MAEAERRLLTFERVNYMDGRIRKHLPAASPRSGWFRGELAELAVGKREIVLAMNFFATDRFARDQNEIHAGKPMGWVVFHVVRKGGRYFSRIVQEEGISTVGVNVSFQPVSRINTGPKSSLELLLLTLNHRAANYPLSEISTSLLITRGLFGGWKEIIVGEPEDEHYFIAKL